jgi:hypothetical protein
VSTPPFRAAGRTRRGVQSLRDLLGRQADAARVISGAHHSSWNGRREPMPPNAGDHIALAGWDGTLHFSQEIYDALQEMFERRGEQHDLATLTRYRSALRAMLHENAHLLMPAGRQVGEAEERAAFFSDASTRTLSEGAIDAWTLRNLNRYLEVLGLDEIAPGILDAPEEVRYPHLAAAADALAERIGDLPLVRRAFDDRGADELLRRMAIEPADRMWRVAAGFMYEASELPDLDLTHRQIAAAKSWLEDGMRAEFRALAGLPDHPKEDAGKVRAAEDGRQAGEWAFRAGAQRLTVLQDRYRGGVEHDAGLIVQQVLDASPPLSGTRRLDPDSFGDRRSRPQTPGSGRQSPDRTHGPDG